MNDSVVDGQCMCVNCRPGLTYEQRYEELWEITAAQEMELHHVREQRDRFAHALAKMPTIIHAHGSITERRYLFACPTCCSKSDESANIGHADDCMRVEARAWVAEQETQ